MHRHHHSSSLAKALETVQAMVQELKSAPAATLEERLQLLAVGASPTVIVDGEQATGKTTLLDSLETLYGEQGLSVIRLACGEVGTSPFSLTAEVIRQAQLRYPQKAAQIAERYAQVLAEFQHRLCLAGETQRLTFTQRDFISYTRVDEQLSMEATIGLMLHTIYYLLELLSSESKTSLILIDDLQLADSWSIAFLLHLVRKIKGLPIAIGLTLDTKAKARDEKIRFFLGKAVGVQVTLKKQRASKREGLSGKSFREAIGVAFAAMPFSQQLVLSYLSVLDYAIGEAALRARLCEITDDTEWQNTLQELERLGAVVRLESNAATLYKLSHHAWRAVVARSVPTMKKRAYHLLTARALQQEIAAAADYDWQLGKKINAAYFHLINGGDWVGALAYHKLYYSCPVNTYLRHANDNLAKLSALVTTETRFGKRVKEQMLYQMASDTVRLARGHTEEKLQVCQRYIEQSSDDYHRAQIYANLAVLQVNQKIAEAQEKALAYCEVAYQCAENISDANLVKHLKAIIHSSKALLYFRAKEATAALEMEQAALDCLADAQPIGNRQVISKLAILGGMAQIHEKLRQDVMVAKALYQELIEEARCRAHLEDWVEHLYSLAKMLYRAGQYDEAAAYFREGIAIAKGHHRLFTTLMYGYKALGNCDRGLGDLTSSSRNLQACLMLAVDIAEAAEIASLTASLAANYAKQQQWQQASQYYSLALHLSQHARLKEQEALYAVHLGFLHTNAGQLEAAAAFFTDAAQIYVQGGKLEEAFKYFAVAIECCSAVGKPCHQGVLEQLQALAQNSNAAVSETVREQFMKACVNQAGLLKSSGSYADTKRLRYDAKDFARPAKSFAILTKSNQVFAKPGGSINE
ncbi:MAG: ATP-binding protein [Acidobacteria bacterium]|nr:ATP-binding protein [Acidobacteriota bacterium]